MNRATPTTRGDVRETTDETARLTVSGSGSSGARYHAIHNGEPACGITARKYTFAKWSVEQAQAWRDPCSYCFPNGDGDSA